MASSRIGDSHTGSMPPPGDRHIVTVLFADVVSSTKLTAELDPDDIREIQDHATGIMANAVRACGGAVVRFQGDGIEAVFGAPKPAEDHALRACLAGLAIQKAFCANPFARYEGAKPQDPLQVRIGIHSGLVIAREMNSDLGHGIDLLGATVSLAALAEKVCPPGSVTATTVTAELAGAFLQARPFQPVGHELAPQYGFVEVLGVDLSSPNIADPGGVFVNRLDEQQLILRAFDETSEGGHVLVLIGDPGIGKSRLSEEIARSAAARQMPVHHVRGLSLIQATPYAPLRLMISSLLKIPERPDGASIEQAAQRLKLDQQEIAGLFEFLGLEGGSTGGGTVAVDRERTERLEEAFCAIVLKAWGPSLGLLIVDDYQLLDAETAACLRRLARRIGNAPIVMLVNGRPEARQALVRLTESKVELAPLGKNEMFKLIDSLAPDIAENSDLADRVVTRSGGVPFILEQILRTMSRQSEPFDERVLPTNVASIVLARLNRLSPRAKQLAQIASVLGEESDLQLLTRVAAEAFAGHSLEKALGELVDAAFFAPLHGDRVRFKHSLIRDACLDSIVRPGRQYLHAKALVCFEQQYDTLTPFLEQLAYHAEGAGRDDLALEYLWSASKNAARNSSVQSLEVLFGRAMACCERLGAAAERREVDFVLLAFDALQQHGKLMNVVPRLGRIVELAQQQGRKDKECLARAHLATVLFFDAQHEKGRSLAERAVMLASEIQAPPALAYSRLMLANLRYGCGDITGAIELLRANVDFLVGDLERAHLGAVGLPSVMSRGFLAWYLVDLGHFQLAEETIARAVEIADAEGRPYSRVLAHVGQARISFAKGDYAATVDGLTHVRDWCWQHRIYAMEPVVTGLLASALCRVGAPQAGLAATEASLAKQFYRGASRWACFYLYAGHGEALYANGDHEGGLKIVGEAVRQTEVPYDPCMCAPGHLLYGQLLLSSGEKERARASFHRALDIAQSTGMAPTAAKAHEGLALCSNNDPGPAFHYHAGEATMLYRQLGLKIPDTLLNTSDAQRDCG
jgi:class 3 adenylate cyclase/tetratricopeptide (TPR) repeat protein